MLTREENELVTRTGPGTPMGEAMRRYWIPALLSRELPEPDCPPVRVQLLGEQLVALSGHRRGASDCWTNSARIAWSPSGSGAMRSLACAACITAGSSTWPAPVSSR